MKDTPASADRSLGPMGIELPVRWKSPAEARCFHLLMMAAVALMIAGHVAVYWSGKWFIEGKEKYNVFTRWVSDFAAVYPEGYWIKGAIVLFCIAIVLQTRAKVRSLDDGVRDSLAWGWHVILSIGVIAGLLLVILYDMLPPPQAQWKATTGIRSLWHAGDWLMPSKTVYDWAREAHHRMGFLIFLCSFGLMLVGATVANLRARRLRRFREDLLILLLAAGGVVWLASFHTLQAGIPQRALLILIFYWIWRGATGPETRIEGVREREAEAV